MKLQLLIRIGLIATFAGLTACQSGKSSEDMFDVTIISRDLQNQIDTGNGERLAKPVANLPLLVNNNLLFTMPGNVALGIAMTIGAINKTTEQLADLPPFELRSIVENNLLKDARLNAASLEPYCYLNGHPKARLESRIKIKSKSFDATIKTTSEPKPLTGEHSWAEDSGTALIETCKRGIKKLSQSISQELDSIPLKENRAALP